MNKWNLKDKSQEEVSKILSDAWMNVIIDENTIFNPLMNIPQEFTDSTHLFFLHLKYSG